MLSNPDFLSDTETPEGEVIMISPSLPKKKKEDNFRSKKYVLTIHDYNDTILSNLKLLSKDCVDYIWGKEICPTTNRPHLQVFLQFKNSRYRTAVKACIDKNWDGYCVGAKGKPYANFKYCSKDKDFCTNMKFKPVPIPIPLELITDLLPFQKSIDKIVDEPVRKKKIIVFLDKVGQLGKTEMMKYLVNKHGCPFSYGGKCSDVINLIFNNKEYFLCTRNAIAIFNFGRETDMDKISYKALEQISDGAISNTKFETGSFIMNCPHIFIFCNNMPNLKKLTSSRFIIYEINHLSLELELCNDQQYVKKEDPQPMHHLLDQ